MQCLIYGLCLGSMIPTRRTVYGTGLVLRISVALIMFFIGAKAEAIQGISPESSPNNHQKIHPPPSHRINFIQGLPLLVGNTQGFSRLDSPLHVACPHLQGADALGLNEVGQGIGILGYGVAEDEKSRERER